ncbi:uncharacterized protein BDV17DRAFT_293978 [Aspergillus undulatus]|uniref:uncharacterized protein n=1 Tax=Aspergillus undulatus TaxID=1810928 RepID=UPI003CCE0439
MLTLRERDDLEFQLSINVTGVHNVTRECIPLTKSSKVKKVANVSSGFASNILAAHYTYARCPAYKISKAALNNLMVQYLLDYKDESFIFIALSPGWLQSDMGGKGADLTISQGADVVLDLVESLEQNGNGCFKNINVPGWEAYNGEDIPW